MTPSVLEASQRILDNTAEHLHLIASMTNPATQHSSYQHPCKTTVLVHGICSWHRHAHPGLAESSTCTVTCSGEPPIPMQQPNWCIDSSTSNKESHNQRRHTFKASQTLHPRWQRHQLWCCNSLIPAHSNNEITSLCWRLQMPATAAQCVVLHIKTYARAHSAEYLAERSTSTPQHRTKKHLKFFWLSLMADMPTPWASPQ
jgi:hypothetical protein